MLINAKGIKKYYKKVKAVDGIDLEVREGEILGLLGPNGAGKSTAISVLSSLIKPDGGDFFFKGESILKNPAVIRKAMGIVPQDVALYPDLSAAELEVLRQIIRLAGEMLNKDTGSAGAPGVEWKGKGCGEELLWRYEKKGQYWRCPAAPPGNSHHG